ncbi:hypothetical protein BSNK01_00070 [Bacillaceae bacterium]
MTEVWKFDDYYCLYTTSRDIMKRIKRYYPDFRVIGEYHRDGRIIGYQYLIPAEKKKVAFRFCKIRQNV